MDTAQTKTKKPALKFEFIGDLFGSLRYLGQCYACGTQFMSTAERAARIQVLLPSGTLVDLLHCEKCAYAAVSK